MYFNRILVTGFVLVFSSSSIFAAKTTTGKPSQSTLAIKPTTPAIKATAAKNTTTKDGISLRLDQSAPNATRKGASPGKIINTRFGSSGNVEEQCQCTLFYLCEQSSIVEGSGIECSDSSFVCCKIPTVIDTIPITPDVNVPLTDLSQQTCVCVPFYQCADYDPLSSTAGAEVINYKFPCKPPDFCCSPDKVISGGGAENPPPIPEKITPKPPTSGSDQSCVCVSSNQCSNYDPSAPTYGEGIIDLKFPCEKPDICCPHEKVIPGGGGQIPPKIPEIPPIPPTSTSQSTCVCVPSNQCSITQTFGEGLINYKFPCQNPDICCPHENVIPGPPYTPEPSPTPSPQPPNIPPVGTPHVDECGIRKATQNKISAPEHLAQTSFGEFPWMALILATEISPSGVKNENVFVCGASLLSPSIVLTAAHCIAHLNPSLLRVRVGEYNTREGLTEPLIHQDRAVSRIVIHNNFNNRTAFNDLALIKVTEDFNFASHISPICTGFTNSIYADPNSYNPSECLATGWGKNAFNQGEFQTTLKRVDLTLIPRDECQSRLRQTKLGQYFLLHESFICAGGQPGFDTCQGDGGGPLVCVTRDNPDRYIQVGVVSWGIGCATDIPGVYASLEANRDWLIAEYNTMNLFSRGKFQ